MAAPPQPPSDLKTQAESLRHGGMNGRARRSERTQRLVGKIYLGLLLFVALVGLPILGVPSLRHRLSSRIHTLREAVFSGGKPVPPVVAKVGENSEPFPKEYEVPLTLWDRTPALYGYRIPVFRPGLPSGAVEAAGNQPGDVAEEVAADAPPEFGQGEAEKRAYELVLASNETIAAMVQGKDQALRFAKWGAARREGDVYWVDLTFNRIPENSEARYIYQVDLESKKVTPLSALARSLVVK